LVVITRNDLYMQQIIRHLFKVDTLDEVSRERLEELVEEYPSFSVARYLLSRKLGTENSDHFTQETQKTNLYFTNPFWLHWLLEETVAEKGWDQRTEAVEGITENGHPTNGNGPLIATGETVELAELPPWAEENVEQPEEKQEEPAVEEIVEQATPVEEMYVEEAPVQEVQVQEVEVQRAPVEDAHSAPEEWVVNEPEAIEERQDEEVQMHYEEVQTHYEEVQTQHEEVQTQHEEVQTPQEELQTEEPKIENAEAAYVETAIEHEHDRVEMAPAEEAIAEILPTEEIQVVPTEQPVVEEPVVPEPIAVEPAAPEPELVFQSYHTIDYFASQGIKFSAEENPSDRLGKQLKSFTAWLKVMKRLPQRPGEAGELAPDIIGEHKIQAIAAHSVEGREPVTETMAEVLEKQGMLQKAADVYHKLSLLNPDKSSYFAAKIGEIQSRFNQTEPGN
jgi:hypothetical protein